MKTDASILPKIEVFPNGIIKKFKDGLLHSETGAAIITKHGGFLGFYLDGKKLSLQDWSNKTGHKLCFKCQRICRQCCLLKTKKTLTNKK